MKLYSRSWLSLAALAGVPLTLIALIAKSAHAAGPMSPAAGITVNTTTDELNNDGDCSLREAIQAANIDAGVDACAAGSGADTINLPAATYTLTLAGADEDGNLTGDLDITDTLTLNGAAMATTIINANFIDRALHVPTAGVTLTLLNLTVRNGNVAGVGINGGGLNAAGSVVLSNTTFISNTAVNLGGGAYFSGTAAVMGTTFISNTAAGGGGLYNAGTLILTNVTVSGNDGHGIYNYYGTLTLHNSTVSSNHGSGIYNYYGTLTLNNSTVSSNFSRGIFSGQNSTVILNSSTVSNNSDLGIFGGFSTRINNSTVSGNNGGIYKRLYRK